LPTLGSARNTSELVGPRVRAAARALRAGELVVYPTDTLLGLGALAQDDRAVAQLIQVKQRSAGQPVSIAVSSLADVEEWAELSPPARRFVRTHLPGPYTIVARPTARARRTLSRGLFDRDGSIAVRVPDHPVARELARRVGPITATSANLHGRPPCRTIRDARRTFGNEVAVYLSTPRRDSGRPSTLVDLAHGAPRLLDRN
jgi:L-threonylcarbamoyladenylate synthase